MSKFLEEAINKENHQQDRFKKCNYRDQGILSRKIRPPSLAERSAVNIDGKSTVNYNKKVMRVQERDNRGLSHLPKELMHNGFLLLDSSYTQAGDPNTMRNQGPSRNVVFNYDARTDPSAQTTEREDDAASMLESRRSQYFTQESPYIPMTPYKERGPITNIEKELAAREAILRSRNGFGFSYDQAEREYDPSEIDDPYNEFYTVVKANDYTKNISEPLFSAGLISDEFGDIINDMNGMRQRNSVIAQTTKKIDYSKLEPAGYTPQKKSSKQKDILNQEVDELIQNSMTKMTYKNGVESRISNRRQDLGLNSAIRPKIPARPKKINENADAKSIMSMKSIAASTQLDKYNNLKKQIVQEREKKKKMQTEVNQLKSSMQSRLDHVNQKMIEKS